MVQIDYSLFYNMLLLILLLIPLFGIAAIVTSYGSNDKTEVQLLNNNDYTRIYGNVNPDTKIKNIALVNSIITFLI